MKPVLVCAPGYDLSLPGFDELHPFDGRKFSRAWGIIRERLGPSLAQCSDGPTGGVGDADLLRVHTSAYLASIRSSMGVVARALEIPLLKLLPRRSSIGDCWPR